MIKKSAVIVSIITTIVSVCNLSWAYHGSVHYKINEAAVESSQLDSVLKDQLGIENGISAELKKDKETKRIWEWIADGGKTEDYGILGEYDFLTTRAFNHFHDPLRDWDEAGLDNILINGLYINAYGRDPVSSVLWGLKPGEQDFFQNRTGDWSWGKARGYYYHALTADTNYDRDENFADCFRALGQVLHLLQDMSVSLHTRNDAHVLPLKIPETEFYLLGKWNYETYTEEYLEDEGEHKLDFIPDQPGDRPDPVLFTDPQPDLNYSNLVPVSGLFDRNQYNEGDTFPPYDNTIGLAEYSNANFLTEDTMWDYQHPSLADTNYDRIDWLNPEPVDAEDGKIDNRIYIKYKDGIGEQIDHLAAIKYWAYQLNFYYTPEIHYAFLLDKKCWKDYADKLIPRAVGYSAGLLDYFFRGKIDLVPDEDNGCGYVIENQTEEDMDGTFELYYDNTDDERIQIISGDFPFEAVIPGNNNNGSVNFTPPNNAKEPGNYILVFRGKLGNEESAVVGSVYSTGTIEITPPDRYVYAILDMSGQSLPGQFTEIKLKLKNTASNNKEMEGGKLIAIARYYKPKDNNFDPSQQAPFPEYMEDEYSCSISAENTSPPPGRDDFTEYAFDFTDNPIPTNVTDLILQIVYRGKLGDEDGVAVGMIDLFEPDHIAIWNNTDYFCNDGTLIRSNYDNDLDGDGQGDVYCSPTHASESMVSFSKEPFPAGVPQTDYALELDRIEAGEFKKIVILQDRETYYYSATYQCEDPDPEDSFYIWDHLVVIGKCDGVMNHGDVRFTPRAFRDTLTQNGLTGYIFQIGICCDGYDWSSEANLP